MILTELACPVEPEKMRIVKRISPLNYSTRASLRIGVSAYGNS